MLTAGDTLPWVAEYDIEFPVDATYTLRVRYASAGVYPADILLDNKPVGKCCLKMTCNAPPYPDRKNPGLTEGLPERTWDKHGAEWETSCDIPITAGKHTLKLTRNGPPPNPITLSLESPVAFPKDWKAPQRKLDLSRIPVRYRNVFLPADAVNTEALRLAIKDTVKTFGPQYAQGPQYLTELADLEKKQLQAAGGSTNDQQTADTALKSLRRRAMLNHPALKFDKLLFVKKRYVPASTYTVHLNRGDDGGNLCVLSPVSADGKVTPLVPELTDGVFGRFDLSFDADKVIFCHAAKDKSYRIYEIDIDPKTGQRVAGKSLRQITRGGADEDEALRCYKAACGPGYDDIDPVYLPNGKIMSPRDPSEGYSVFLPR
jgi:hypothetical protein